MHSGSRRAALLEEFAESPLGSFDMDAPTPFKAEFGGRRAVDKENVALHSALAAERRATVYDYLDYGNFINRVTGRMSTAAAIDWRLKTDRDKSAVVNLVLFLLDERKSTSALMEDTRDSVEEMRRTKKHDSLCQKELAQNLRRAQAQSDAWRTKWEALSKAHKAVRGSLSTKLATAKQQLDELKYVEKQREHECRKLDKKCEALKQKVRELLAEKDKRAMKGITVVGDLEIGKSQLSTLRSKEALMEEMVFLRNDNGFLQTHVEKLVAENESLRMCLLRLEKRCTEELAAVIKDSVVASATDGCDDGADALLCVSQSKYALPFDLSKPLIVRAVDSKLASLKSAAKQSLERTEAKRRAAKHSSAQSEERLQQMHGEVGALQQRIQQLELSNSQYESLVQDYMHK